MSGFKLILLEFEGGRGPRFKLWLVGHKLFSFWLFRLWSNYSGVFSGVVPKRKIAHLKYLVQNILIPQKIPCCILLQWYWHRPEPQQDVLGIRSTGSARLE